MRPRFRVGDAVKAKYGGMYWSRGRVAAVETSPEGHSTTYTVEFDDGDVEAGIADTPAHVIDVSERPQPPAAAPTADDTAVAAEKKCPRVVGGGWWGHYLAKGAMCPRTVPWYDGFSPSGSADVPQKMVLGQPRCAPRVWDVQQDVLDPALATAIYKDAVSADGPWGVYVRLDDADADTESFRERRVGESETEYREFLGRQLIRDTIMRRFRHHIAADIDATNKMHGAVAWVLSSGANNQVVYHIDYAEAYRYQENTIYPPLYAGTVHVSPCVDGGGKDAASAASAAAVDGSGEMKGEGEHEHRPPPPYPVVGDESIMSAKDHGTCSRGVQSKLRWRCNRETADDICCFNRHYAEPSGYWRAETDFLSEVSPGETTTFCDSVSGKPLFIAPRGRSFDEFVRESERHGWPSFRDEEVVWENVRCLANGECVSLAGTHLGHLLPDEHGKNRYCINLVSVAGRRREEEGTPPPSGKGRGVIEGGSFVANLNGLDHYREFGYKGRLKEGACPWADDEAAVERDPARARAARADGWVRVPYRYNQATLHSGDLPHCSTRVRSLPEGVRRVIVGINVFDNVIGPAAEQIPEHSNKFRKTIRLSQTVARLNSGLMSSSGAKMSMKELVRDEKSKDLVKFLYKLALKAKEQNLA